MTMEAAGLVEHRRDGAEHVNKVGYAHKSIKKKRFRKKVQRYIPRDPQVLQELFVSCRDVFKGPGTVPSPSDVQNLCRILDNMEPEDVGLSSELQFFSAQGAVRGTPIVTSTTIYKCENFSLCLFFLPATAVIPLHNHPGMTVFSKLLLGTMHIKSYDLVDSANSQNSATTSNLSLARLVADSDFTAPCDTSVLYPTTGGNIHEFTAITTCAVLDVLGPPYNNDDGRDGSYYKEIPLSETSIVPEFSTFTNAAGENPAVTKEEGDTYMWLEEIEIPENSHMDEIEYLGPQINDTRIE